MTQDDFASKAATLVQHAGSQHRLGSGLIGAVEISTTFTSESLGTIPKYARLSDTKNHLEVNSLIAALNETEEARVYGSGMAAMSALCFTFLKPGDHILAQNNCYGSNQSFITKVLGKFGIESTFCPIESWPTHRTAKTKLCYFESISNPFCHPQNIALAVSHAKSFGAMSLCDNTFASPINCRPSQLGVDIVLDSGTKYLNGHSDLICGTLAAKRIHLKELDATSMYLGGFLHADGCSTLAKGLRTLPFRMQAHNQNAKFLALELAKNQDIFESINSGWNHDANTYSGFSGFGGMLSLAFQASIDVEGWIDSLKYIRNCPSLGGTETIATMPYHTTHFWESVQKKKELKIDKKLVRLSVGLENPRDLFQDIIDTARRFIS